MIVDGSGFTIFIEILVNLFNLRKRYREDEREAKKKDEWLRSDNNDGNKNR
jgi:hypothetical protein